MPSTAPAASRVDRVVRYAAKAAVAIVAAFLALLLAIRVVVYPQLEAHRTAIASWLGTKIGSPVEIDAIVTGWEGWNPRLSIRGLRVKDTAGDANVLDLPRVDLLIAWTSLPRLDLRLKELAIDSPRLAARRDAQGRLHIAGFAMSVDARADDSAFVDWLLRQPQVSVRDALVVWDDELRGAPQLLLDHVALRLEQRFGHHRVGLTGVPPAELAGPIDVRADVTGLSRKDLSRVRGKLYFRLDYADVAAWREWLPLPLAIESGRGALRVWADVAGGLANSVVADLELADVRTTLGADLAPLGLDHVAGHAEWSEGPGRIAFKGSRLSLALPNGETIGPTTLEVTLEAPTATAPGRGSVALTAVDLQPLAAIAAHLPLPDAVRRDIARYAPQGSVHNAHVAWTGNPAAPERYVVDADVSRFAIASQDGLPGVTNLSARVDMNERGGDARIAGDESTIVLPKLFAEPLALDTVSGSVHWQNAADATEVRWNDVAFASTDLAGSAGGTWHSARDGPGSIDVTARLSRANLANAYRYVPVSAPAVVRDWMRNAIVKGTSNDASLALAGDLAHVPFAEGQGGRFELDVKARDVSLNYADRWPMLTGVAADVRIDGARVVIDASTARVNDAQVGATRAEIADVRDANATLRVAGNVSGTSAQFLAFVAASPVAGWLDHASDGIAATGNGQLSLAFALPLHDHAQATLNGEYVFTSNDVQVSGMPLLSAAAGKLSFTEHDVRASDITGQALGGPVKLAIASNAGHLVIDGTGTADMAFARKAFDVPLLARVAGSTDWHLAVDAHDGQVGWTLGSSLAGAAVDLPAPIGKPASTTVPVRIEHRASGVQDERISVDYGGIARIVLHRRDGGARRVVDRALVLVGKSIGDFDAEQPGVWIRADVAAIDVDAWLAVDLLPEGSGVTATQDDNVLAVNGIDLRAATITALGRQFSDVKTTARRRGADWRLVLEGSQVAGVATWRGATPAQPNGRVTARLTQFRIPPAAQGAEVSATTTSGASRWPGVDLVADTVEKKGRALGKLELQALPSGSDWQIRKLALANDAGRIEAHGWWRNASPRPQTELEVAIDVREAGAFLARFGWPDAVKGAPTKIEGQVSWAGAPSDFDYASLAGHFSLRAGAGQFTKLDPGVGRLLGVLSLQALPRRISLDFRDVFSEGFAFDSVVGDVRMNGGVMHADNLRLSGPAAGVDIAGDVDLAHETQQLSVRVQPSLSTGVSAGAAALFIANPLIGAAVGAGALLAQKMLNNPFDQLFSYRYVVSGSFDDPVVTRANARAASAAPSSATIR
jgi:uncharacterized protein (TIGR02099 family)